MSKLWLVIFVGFNFIFDTYVTEAAFYSLSPKAIVEECNDSVKHLNNKNMKFEHQLFLCIFRLADLTNPDNTINVGTAQEYLKKRYDEKGDDQNIEKTSLSMIEKCAEGIKDGDLEKNIIRFWDCFDEGIKEAKSKNNDLTK